ncbi:MAG: hypothetical protein RRY29_05935 [Desulfovibrionaceae bacterium]
MSQILPQGELVRRAAAYIAEERHAKPDVPLSHILDEAGMRFTLSPLESEALCRLFSADLPDSTAIGHGGLDG